MDCAEYVLLIDDDRITNYLNQRTISKMYPCMDIVVKNNGKEALNYIKSLIDSNNPLPTYIFLDLNMPVLNGFDFLLAFNKLNISSDIPTITILTTSNNSDDIEKINLLGNYSYVTKPLTSAKLSTVVDANLLTTVEVNR